MVKVIRDIIRSSHAPANKNVLWLDTSSKSPILMGWYRGEWAPVTSGDTGSMVKSVDLFEIDSMLESGELQPGEWIDITPSYINSAAGMSIADENLANEGDTLWCLTRSSSVDCVYFIQVWEPNAKTYCGEGFIRNKNGGENQFTHTHFTLTKFTDSYCPIYGGSINEMYEIPAFYLMTECKILETNSTFNFDPFMLSPADNNARIMLDYSLENIGREYISCNREMKNEVRIPVDRIRNSSITIGKFFPIWGQRTTIVNSTINNSIVIDNCQISNSTITNSVVSGSYIFNSTVTECLYGVGDHSNYSKFIRFDYDDDHEIYEEEYTTHPLNLYDSNISHLTFTPCGIFIQNDYSGDSSDPWSTKPSMYSLSKFDNLNLEIAALEEGTFTDVWCILMWTGEGHPLLQQKPTVNLYSGYLYPNTPIPSQGSFRCYPDLTEDFKVTPDGPDSYMNFVGYVRPRRVESIKLANIDYQQPNVQLNINNIVVYD